MSSGVNSPFIETDSIQNVCQQILKKKKNQSDKEILDQVQKQNPSDHPEVNNSAQISDDGEEYEDDGRIHSLSCKYRPYVCPK